MQTPCLYVIGFNYFPLPGVNREAEKVGTTWHPESRKFQYTTAHATVPTYRRIYKLDPSSFTNHADLYNLDSIKFPVYLKKIKRSNLHVELGGGTEFYWRDEILYKIIEDFLEFHKIRILEIIYEDPYSVPPTTSDTKRRLRDIISHETELRENTLWNRFLSTFLPGKTPRRIQIELWDKFDSISDSYKGIVQWPTGVGKTTGMLMLTVLAAEKVRQNGEYYRGIIVSPKNDIFDTISKDFIKLSEFGINIYDGTHAEFSKMSFPTNKHILIIATHAAVVTSGLNSLPPITHFHYDEVHRITGEKLFEELKVMLKTWNTKFLTGTSATPLTCSGIQRDRIAELFGDDYIMSRCDMDEAIKEGWIATPRFHVNIVSKSDDRPAILKSFVDIIEISINKKKTMNWNGGKVIAYIPTSIEDVRFASEYAKQKLPTAKIYTAIGSDKTDTNFCNDPADGTTRILFACQKYREGSDIRGIEMTCTLVGDYTAANIMIQTAGRALRNDYHGKEGWCVIVRPSEDGTTEENVLDTIILNILELQCDLSKVYDKTEIKRLVDSMLTLFTNGNECDTETTILRIQSAYIRREFRNGTLTFDKARALCLTNNIRNISDYKKFRDINACLPFEPWRDRMTAYDFFHPEHLQRMPMDVFKNALVANLIFTTEQYYAWAQNQKEPFPTVEDCVEGYFAGINNFQQLLPEGRRRR